MPRPVVIVAPQNDVHATTVAKRIQQAGGDCQIVDVQWSNDEHALIAGTAAHFEKIKFGDIQIDSRTSVWWRRAQLPISNHSDPVVRNFVVNEKRHALYGAIHATGCRIVNDPFAESRANHKILQLRVAKEVGFRVPVTVVTNEGTVAREFIRELSGLGKRVVFKPFTPSRYHMGETRLIAESEVDDQALSQAPVIFQEFIPKGEDLRVFVCGDDCFAVRCVTPHTELVDWRLDPLVQYEPCELAPALKEKCLELLKLLNLETGSFDFRTSADTDEVVFFEINPSGQFLFMETDSGHPVSQGIAKLLMGG